MTFINPLQTALYNPNAQLGNIVQHTAQANRADPYELHNLGLTTGLLQNLRYDLNAVSNGANPDRALNGLLAGLRQVLPSSGDGIGTQEWPANRGIPAGTRPLELVKDQFGQSVALNPARDWPADKEFPAGTRFVELVKGKDGQSVVVGSSDVPLNRLQSLTSPVQGHADKVISNLQALLSAETAGTDLALPLAGLRSALQPFSSGDLLANNSGLEQAFINRIRSQDWSISPNGTAQ